ncbi:MAG TPA: hypothetical protein PKV03_02765 [Methylotenera sp.]|nr:hypothetical protein [Methylotenera sp.]HPN00329.1 hypothetical protein [Methylotenera sp.]
MSQAVQDNSTSAVMIERRRMFNQFCQTLDNQNIPYVILSGYQGYPDQIDSDVDFMVSEADFAKLPHLFKESKTHFGAPLIQVLQHETTACYYILANQVGGRIAYLHPDAAASYRRKGRLWLQSDAVLSSRQQTATGFWVPATAVEFEYYFVKRIDKRLVEARHLERLASLLASDFEACHAVVASLVPANQVEMIINAIQVQDVAWFASQRDVLQAMLADSHSKESLFARLSSFFKNVIRQVHRILHPTGLVVAVLGPDGSGKTTVIEHIESEFSPAFRKLNRYHLRPHFGKQGTGSVVTNPHASPPRSALAGLAKMVLFLVDYWWGYIRRIYPAKVRSTLVIFDRHFYDMLVDPTRYRLPQRFWPAKLFAKLIPQPDVWLVLDAPPALLVSRKGEIDLTSAEMLTSRYRALAQSLPNAYIVNTGGTLEETYSNAIRILLAALAKRQGQQV